MNDFEMLMSLLLNAPDFDDMNERTNKVLETLHGLNIIETQTILCTVIHAVAETVGIDRAEFAQNIADTISAGATE